MDDYRPTGTKVCTMSGTLFPSGSYSFVSGTLRQLRGQSADGARGGAILVRAGARRARRKVLTIDGSSCIDLQSVVTSPLP